MKQAVVLIHGIGEQKPMSTLRSFVRAVLPAAAAGKNQFWNKPDRMSESFELRRLQSIGRPTTHFYEYYWAYNVEGTTVWHVLGWLVNLIRRPHRDVPPSAKTLWWLLRGFVVVLAALAATGVFAKLHGWVESLKSFGLASLLVSGLGLIFYFFLLYYLGDAARYCSAAPHNIRLRQTIRTEGLQLLRTLHERGEYDRIVVVGHSLGSVIGYDLVKRLWQEYHDRYPGLQDPGTQAAVRLAMQTRQPIQKALRDEISQTGEALTAESSDADIRSFQETQGRVLDELKLLGNPWRITDFITMGSPLVHSMLLLADGELDFEARKHQREFPTCPPQRDKKGYAYSGSGGVDVGENKKFTPLFLHHAAPFAVTRWTNLYFPAWAGIFGDFVGGPLRSVLGHGIRDIAVRTQALAPGLQRTLLTHTQYWNEKKFEAALDDHPDAQLALAALRQALSLSRKHFDAEDGADEEEEGGFEDAP
jgi:hypothetical protein